jgi:hypothetical protein
MKNYKITLTSKTSLVSDITNYKITITSNAGSASYNVVKTLMGAYEEAKRLTKEAPYDEAEEVEITVTEI